MTRSPLVGSFGQDPREVFKRMICRGYLCNLVLPRELTELQSRPVGHSLSRLKVYRTPHSLGLHL